MGVRARALDPPTFRKHLHFIYHRSAHRSHSRVLITPHHQAPSMHPLTTLLVINRSLTFKILQRNFTLPKRCRAFRSSWAAISHFLPHPFLALLRYLMAIKGLLDGLPTLPPTLTVTLHLIHPNPQPVLLPHHHQLHQITRTVCHRHLSNIQNVVDHFQKLQYGQTILAGRNLRCETLVRLRRNLACVEGYPFPAQKRHTSKTSSMSMKRFMSRERVAASKRTRNREAMSRVGVGSWKRSQVDFKILEHRPLALPLPLLLVAHMTPSLSKVKTNNDVMGRAVGRLDQ